MSSDARLQVVQQAVLKSNSLLFHLRQRYFYNVFIQSLTIFALLGSLFDWAELHGAIPSPWNRHFKRLRMQSTLFTCTRGVKGCACNQPCSRDCTRVRMGVVSTLGVRGNWNVRLGRATGCGYDKERYPNEETEGAGAPQEARTPAQRKEWLRYQWSQIRWNSQERNKALTRTMSELNQNTIIA